MITKRFRLFLILLFLFFPLTVFAGGRAEVVQLLLNGMRDYNGKPLTSGKVYTYASGSNSLKDTYLNIEKSSKAANPVVLDSNGQAQIYADGNYKFVIKDKNDVTLYTYDSLNFKYDALETISGLLTTGTSTNYAVTISPAPGGYYTCMTIIAKAHTTSGASPTLNVNGLGAVPLKNKLGNSLASGDLVAGQVFIAVHDGTNFLVVDGANPTSEATWTSWTPTITIPTGSLATTSLGYARYLKIGKLVHIQIAFAAGVSSGSPAYLNFTLPYPSASSVGDTYGSSYLNTLGVVSMGQLIIPTNSSSGRFYKSDLSALTSTSYTVATNFFYETP